MYLILVGSTPTALAISPAHRARVGLQLLDEVGHRLDRRARRHDDRVILAGEPGERRHVGERHRRLVGDDGADHDVAADDELGRVALVVVDELGEADGAAGARHVDDLDIADDAGLLEDALHGARGLVPATAGGGGRHDGELGGGGDGRARQGGEGAGGSQSRPADHDHSSRFSRHRDGRVEGEFPTQRPVGSRNLNRKQYCIGKH